MTETNGSTTDNANHETTDQLTFQNPVTRYPEIEPPIQDQPEPGLDADLVPKTDRGEFSYRGTGRLQGRIGLPNCPKQPGEAQEAARAAP